MKFVLVLASMLFALWAAGVSAGWISFGTYGVLLAVALACLAAASLPWASYWKR